VSGIGEQRHRIGDEAIGRLDHHESEVEADADRERSAEAGRLVPVAVMTMSVVAAGTVMMVSMAALMAVAVLAPRADPVMPLGHRTTLADRCRAMLGHEPHARPAGAFLLTRRRSEPLVHDGESEAEVRDSPSLEGV